MPSLRRRASGHRRRRRLAALLAASLALLVPALAPTATAVPVGALGASTDLGAITDPLVTYDVATLPDGTTLVAWETAAPALLVRARPAGSSTWGPVRVRTLLPGASFSTPITVGDGLAVRPLGDSAFLVTWLETVGMAHVRAVVLPKAPTSIPAPSTVSGADPVASYAGATNAAGRAAISYFTGPGRVKTAVRSTPTAAWSTPVQISSSANAGYYPDVAVSSTGAVTVVWTKAAPPFPMFVRTRATTSWGPPTTLPATVPVQAGWVSVAAAGASFVLAQMILGTGLPPTNGVPDDPATQIRTWTKASAAAGWSAAGTYGLAAQRLMAPQVLGAPDGSAVVTYTRYEASAGSTSASKSGTGTTWLVQRRGSTGSWSAPALMSSISLNQAPTSILALRAGKAALSPDGTLISPAISMGPGTPVPALTTGLRVRSGWNGTYDDPRGQSPVMVFARSAIGDGGRATLIGATTSGGPVHLAVQSTALPKPYVRTRAALSSAAPRVGTKVACTSAWTDAASVAYRWRRGSSTIGAANASTYRPSAADRGRSLSCLVIAKNPSGATTSTSVPRKVR